MKANLLFGFFLLLSLAACASQPAPAVPTTVPSATPSLIAYQRATATPTLTPDLRATETPTLTPFPTPTPTPVTYTVAKNDDMLSIALRNHISLAELIAANPTINPNLMSIGTVLIIPVSAENLAATPTPTPLPVPLSADPPTCFSNASGGLTCLMLVHNNGERPVENLSGQLILLGSDGFRQAQTAWLPVNLLQEGAALPLTAEFAPPLPPLWQISGEILSALPVEAADTRYLPVTYLAPPKINIAASGLSAEISGSLALDQGKAGQIRLAATAYDQQGRPVGIRLWENKAPLIGGENMAFDFSVYTLGPRISRVTLSLEAR
ncbi:MAG TPA: LysM domain-containing protein [Anaerolineaceae bacterium]|nr:LysM domain-containing protein [Anaerolineaceae bacterium]HPN50746.1 LysM domain-containing protein [Anaerolineaceae bacterium]